jgi:hypothetical protein
MINLYQNDPSGKKKKYSYMSIHHPEIAEQILNWSKEKNIYGLPFDELTYLYVNKIENVPKDDLGYKTYKGFNKGYSAKGKFKKIDDKFIEHDLNAFKEKLSKKDFYLQHKGGYISQLLIDNYILIKKINDIYPQDIDTRHKINLFLNGKEIPKCINCGSKAKQRLTHGEFRSTCSEKCRRHIENRYKYYVLELEENKNIKVQGYERFVIPELLKKYKREDIEIGFEIPFSPIKYKFKGLTKDYFPDIFIKPENKIIEVKSSYTYDCDEEKNLAKKEACIELGFNFEFHIWDLNKIL